MRRDLARIADGEFDLVIVGGGIFGICAAWDAVLRGLSVALVERRDFAHAASANCFKVVHGGVRYLQHGDLRRLRQSSRERNALLRVAPHQVRPLPIVIPTYGHGINGKEILGTALKIYDLLAFDRNYGIRDPERRLPPGRLLTRAEVLVHFPALPARDLTGAGLLYDGQMHSPARLALAFLRSAAARGAQATNYVAATGFIRSGDRVTGITARDDLSGRDLRVHGKVVLNAAGPWAEGLLARTDRARLSPASAFSRDAYFVLRRSFHETLALAVRGRTRDPDALLSREARHLFIVPWRGYSLVGVWHVVYDGPPDEVALTERDVQVFLNEINGAYPGCGATLAEVTRGQCGLVLFGENEPGAVHLSYGKRSRLVDHARTHGVHGLITLVGVRYTTARSEADRAVDLVLEKLGRPARPSSTAWIPIWGGDIELLDAFTADAIRRRPAGVGEASIRNLVRGHGTRYTDIMKYVTEDPTLATTMGSTATIGAEIVYAVREEMAQTLADAVLRRTDLGTAEDPGPLALRACAGLMARELDWSPSRTEEELRSISAHYPTPRADASPTPPARDSRAAR